MQTQGKSWFRSAVVPVGLMATLLLPGVASAGLVDFQFENFHPPELIESGTGYTSSFDISSISSDYTLTSLILSLDFTGASDEDGEFWVLRGLGSNDTSPFDDVFTLLADSASAQATTYSLTADLSSGTQADVFAHSVDTGLVEFSLQSLGPDGPYEMELSSQTLQAFATKNDPPSNVSLPAPAILMAIGLAGIAGQRRVKGKA